MENKEKELYVERIEETKGEDGKNYWKAVCRDVWSTSEVSILETYLSPTAIFKELGAISKTPTEWAEKRRLSNVTAELYEAYSTAIAVYTCERVAASMGTKAKAIHIEEKLQNELTQHFSIDPMSSKHWWNYSGIDKYLDKVLMIKKDVQYDVTVNIYNIIFSCHNIATKEYHELVIERYTKALW